MDDLEKQVLDWLDALCLEADAHSRAGDLSFLNRMTANAGINHYFANVHKLRAIPREQWQTWYPTQWGMALMAWEAVQAAGAQSARMDNIEAQLNDLKALILERLPAPTRKGK